MMDSLGDHGDHKVVNRLQGDNQNMSDHEFPAAVLSKFDELRCGGKLIWEDLDERALAALKQFTEEKMIVILNKLEESNLDHVSNKSAYLCGIMRAIRNSSQYQRTNHTSTTKIGPDRGKLTEILSRTGYTLNVTTGQRKYGGPPPDWVGSSPGKSCELYCGNIPRDLYEDDLIPMFEKCGKIWELRLMMDGSMTGHNRGFAFVTFTSPDEAMKAVQELHNLDVAPGQHLIVKNAVSNTRLFVGNIPKSKSQEEIAAEFEKYGGGLIEVLIYPANEKNAKNLNRGFCFLDYKTHQSANQAKKSLSSGRSRVWGCDIIVDWADPQEEPDKEIMDTVKILYCRNIPFSVSAEMLGLMFQKFGRIERVKRIKDYAFVHFEKREEAFEAMSSLQGKDFAGSKLDINWVKPPADKKKKEEVLRRREQRMMETMAKSMTYPSEPDYYECRDVHDSVYDRTGRGDIDVYGWGYDEYKRGAYAGEGAMVSGEYREKFGGFHPECGGGEGNRSMPRRWPRVGLKRGHRRGAVVMQGGDRDYADWVKGAEGEGILQGYGGYRRGNFKKF